MSDGTRAAGALQTREALLDAGAALAEEHGLAGVSVNMVVARAGVAKGTFYVHFSGRAAFVDAMHARFHARVQEVIDEAIAGLPPGAERLFRGSEAYLDVSLANRGSRRYRSRPAPTRPRRARWRRGASASHQRAWPTWRRWAGTTPRRRRNCWER